MNQENRSEKKAGKRTSNNSLIYLQQVNLAFIFFANNIACNSAFFIRHFETQIRKILKFCTDFVSFQTPDRSFPIFHIILLEN